MTVTGAKPKDGPKVGHVKPVHEWVEVPNRRWTGKRPALPEGAPPETAVWWEAVTTLPHCRLWRAGDWQFAVDTSRVHKAFINGDMARAAELRLRERQMGTTSDALRDLRIRYVDGVVEAAPAVTDAVDLQAERRRRLTHAG